MELTQAGRGKGIVLRESAARVASGLGLVVTLFKLRIVALLLLSAVAGAALGAAGGGEWTRERLLLLLLTGGLSAAGSSALNQYLERDRDGMMVRTHKRPLPAGRFRRTNWLAWLSSGMVLLAVALAAMFNIALALFVALGAVIYVGVYTVWLKPRTPLNIVIGGAAGSCAVLCGGAAMGAWLAPGTWLLAALLFVWTPVHFWSLALAYRDDYASAGYPMLPAQVSPSQAARWTALHAVATILLALLLGLWPQVEAMYLIPTTLATLYLAQRTVALLRDPGRATALALFHTSNSYLAIVLVVILLAW